MWNVVNFSNVELWMQFFHRIVSNGVGTLRWDQCWQDFFDLNHKKFGLDFPNLCWTSTFSHFNFLKRIWFIRQLWSTFTLRKTPLCHLNLNWTLLLHSSCIYFCQQEWSLLILWRRPLRILEEEGKRGTFTESRVKPFWFDPNLFLAQDFESNAASELFRVQKTDSKRDFCGDVGIRSAAGATLHPWISRELHPDFELLEVQILHGKVSSKLLRYVNVYFTWKKGLEWNRIYFFMWPNLRVESLYPPAFQMDPALCPLRKEDFCPFMPWVTLPRDYVRAMMHHTLETGWNFGATLPLCCQTCHATVLSTLGRFCSFQTWACLMVGPEMAYMGEHLNFAFSPRSALFATCFQYIDLSCPRNFSYAWEWLWSTDHCWVQATLARLGVELWNRCYLDYFVHFFRSLPGTLMNHTFISCVHHGVNTLHLVEYFNNFRNHPGLSVLMHIPMTRDQRRAVEHWNFPVDTPWYIVADAARSRLWSWSWMVFLNVATLDF